MQSNGEGVAVIMDNMSLILFVQIMCFKQKTTKDMVEWEIYILCIFSYMHITMHIQSYQCSQRKKYIPTSNTELWSSKWAHIFLRTHGFSKTY